jgi:hypothetical protein
MFSFFSGYFMRMPRNYSISHPLVSFGILSMYIFVVHGFLRPQIIMLIGDGGWFVKLVHALLFLLIATGAAIAARFLQGFFAGMLHGRAMHFGAGKTPAAPQ